MTVRPLAALLLFLAFSAAAQTPAVSPSGRIDYEARELAALDIDTFAVLRSATGLPYRLLAPSAPAPAAGYPLVLVLHGSGAIGTDNRAQMGAFAKSWALPQVRAEFPAFVVAPQAPARTADYIPGPDGVLASHAGAPLQAVLALVDELAARLPVDRRRIYVTGFSMGASGAYQALLARPALFAAAVPVAGIAPPRGEAARLRGVPLLIVHGDADEENPPQSDYALFAALGNGAKAQLVVHAGLRHEIAPEILYGRWWRTWLFAQAR